MNDQKIGLLIQHLRKEKGFTQQALADAIHISNKAISKWECGNGVPDVSLWPQLSNVLEVDIAHLMHGDLKEKQIDIGNLAKMQFYICPICGNIITCSSSATMVCCGRPLLQAIPTAIDDDHSCQIEWMDTDHYITFSHDMTKQHYLSFVAFVRNELCILHRLYPEQEASLRIPSYNHGILYYYCTKHGLKMMKL